ncbi:MULTISPECIES: glycerophosphodiester phosphodiesterase [Pseudoalteromonas]|uniref:Glycerophosphodiester phosphodiesterase n=1 Tax=Pseudoalteromonas rubra TaxID=43658 RepID=A0A4V2E3W3_9GAMM|nr:MULTISPECIES: glycerophosphodiester phosphodiesterase family protein [Pseudoalteromonas]MCF2908756.1 glycerophosphodiester phosphodiesterase [Pseudoalteromonas sp. DL2-H2.2]RZM83882.1 glycerophosphodiester phosphodiesterase [Pseudoalteromonas rubra]
MIQVYAHRGASGNYPENSLSAIKAALEVGVDGIELDVQSCLDDYAIIHDTWLDRTTNGRGKVNETTRAALSQLKLSNNEAVPTLQQVLDTIGQQTTINLELKHTFSLDKFVATIEDNVQRGIIARHQLLLSSFDHHQLLWLKQKLPWVRIGALTASIPLTFAQFAQQLHAESIHMDKNFINHEFVQDAKQRGLKVLAYTVDKAKDIELMLDYGVDGIFSNYPCYAKMVVQQQLNQTSAAK